MCRTPTPAAERVACGRCGKCANPNDGWEHGWPLEGEISMGFSSCAFARLARRSARTVKDERSAWSRGHPAFVENEAQHVRIRWTHESAWRLCHDCQGELLEILGEFFGYGLPQRTGAPA